ncbi:hypothetical protein [Candidatus Cyanaurora vandensis]|uniref:hypothetical protein n=1 Tax=Candidatus Cyanaurora vandensis TaxID=2714958 RepID=UPI002580E51E|nr:hypothetical protein [Candidatus Cyanaurora vandensis]
MGYYQVVAPFAGTSGDIPVKGQLTNGTETSGESCTGRGFVGVLLPSGLGPIRLLGGIAAHGLFLRESGVQIQSVATPENLTSERLLFSLETGLGRRVNLPLPN